MMVKEHMDVLVLRTSSTMIRTSIILFLAFTSCFNLVSASSSFDESLTIRPLQDGRVHAVFKFDLSSPFNSEEKDANHLPIYSFVPRSLVHLAQSSNAEDIRLAINAGRWDYNKWGIPIDEQMVGTGAEVRAKLRLRKADPIHESVLRDWRTLTANMAGLFCASLDALDEKLTIEPFNDKSDGNQYTTLHAMLSSESICTENLSTLLKLLPCKTMAGLSSLLKPHQFFLSDFHGMTLHLYRSQNSWKVRIHIQAVFSPALAPSTRGKRDWTLAKLFGTKLQKACPLVRSSSIKVLSPPQNSITKPKDEQEVNFRVWPIVMTHTESYDIDEDESLNDVDKLMKKAERFALQLHRSGSYTFDTRSSNDLNVEMTWPKEQYYAYPSAYIPQKLAVSRIFSGNGQERGTIQLSITNLEQTRERRVVYREVLPWFIKVYLHTMQEKIIEEIDGSDESIVLFTDDLNTPVVQSLNYTPSIPRERPTNLQVQLRIPPLSTVRLTFEYDKAFLRYAEHPPDAHRGFDVAPAIIGLEDGTEIYTEPALVEVAVPDFSMPYNVIIFTSTLIALCAGSTLNNLIRKYTDVIQATKSDVKKGF